MHLLSGFFLIVSASSYLVNFGAYSHKYFIEIYELFLGLGIVALFVAGRFSVFDIELD